MKLIISEKQEKKLIKEYLTKDNGMPLWNYFKDYKSLSPHELVSIVDSAPQTALYEIFTKKQYKDISDYIYENYGKEMYDYLKMAIMNFSENEDVVKILKEFILNDDKLTEFTANIINDNKEWFRDYAFLFVSNPKISHNKWYVHMTRKGNGENIYKNGFLSRVNKSNLHNMAFSKSRGNKNGGSKEGYVYAYDVDKVSSKANEYIILNSCDLIMFQGNGVEFYHEHDGDEQVMIPIESIHNVVLCKCGGAFNAYDEYVVVTNDGRELFKNRPLEVHDCIEWVKTNFEQYKNILVGRNG